MTETGCPSLSEDAVKLLENLPLIISEARHGELWGVELGGNDDKNREIIVRKVLEISRSQ
ncbi:hypothetical protein BO78DRAFT_394067 [Aspergillus sclerotiicarbonarius CBS 121057]|uniref:Uncharacterized protein n=1 Tax=Aspergillus sclerotiicarbonarius (strain CBS 121057 / IBT 28362) TaxID=1448318 RepID=A0A319ETL6_ASPSB|nr:hypothetical protein BO78DRAFT_394067 [Aspergillus sclerotiicarbonarius CBS 121057]